LRHHGVVIHPNTQVRQAIGRGGTVTGVETESGETIPCQVLAVAIGVRPCVDLARQAGLKVERGIAVNVYLQTSRPDVFAAGDVAQICDPAGGAAPMDVLWSTALRQGRIAGANMAGAGIAYAQGIAFNVTQLAGLQVTIIGAIGRGKGEDLISIGRGDSEAWRLLLRACVVADLDDVNRVRLVIGERQIVGALVMGDQTWSRPLQRLIVARADITPIRSAMLGDPATALMHLAQFYQQWESR
jgi:NADPH-dependent 2,4-dienoyl-CoA reductase/sulfur reductase-like enzyme